MTQRVTLCGETQRAHACDLIQAAPDNAVMTLQTATQARTSAQNALLHKWYGEIATQSRQWTASQVKGRCHVDYGLVIRRREPVFEWVWSKVSQGLDYEAQCRLFEQEGRSDVLRMSSAMTKAELTEYMDAMSHEYRGQGYRLTDPEDRKWEREDA